MQVNAWHGKQLHVCHKMLKIAEHFSHKTIFQPKFGTICKDMKANMELQYYKENQ